MELISPSTAGAIIVVIIVLIRSITPSIRQLLKALEEADKRQYQMWLDDKLT